MAIDLPDSSATSEGSEGIVIEESSALIDFSKDTCAIVGTTHKGPAFVPKSFTQIGEEIQTELGDNVNTFARYFGDPTGSVNLQSNARLAAQEWLENGLNKQVSFIRVLGAGDGNPSDNRGFVNKAGFVVGNEQVSGSLNHGKASRNKYAGDGGPLGRTFFLGGFYENKIEETSGNLIHHPHFELLSQFNITGLNPIPLHITDESNSVYPIINGILMFPSGVYPSLKVGEENPLDVAKDFYGAGGNSGQQIGKYNNLEEKECYTLLLNGLDEDNTYEFNFNKSSEKYYVDVLNKDPQKIEEKGHLLYASFDPVFSSQGGLRPIKEGYTSFILSSSLGRNSSNATTPNFEDFRSRYKIASTPWIVSQTFEIQNTNRSHITGSIQDLFKIYARTDGASGNEDVYIIIHPKRLETEAALSNTRPEDPGVDHAVFGLYVIDYKTDTVLEKFDECNLHPKSKNFIGKKIGTQYEYYNWEVPQNKQKVVIKGEFLNQSQYIRVELSDNVSEGKIAPITMPSGFRGYRHITTDVAGSNVLGTISDFSNSGNDINNDIFANLVSQCPVPYTIQLHTRGDDSFRTNIDNLEEKRINSKIENPTWGVNNRFSYAYTMLTVDRSDQFTGIDKPDPAGRDHYFSNYQQRLITSERKFDFSKYFPDFVQDGTPAHWYSNSEDNRENIDNYNNNLFHLERIIVQTGNDGSDKPGFINWNLATYRRDGKNLDNMNENVLSHSDYSRYFNINKDLERRSNDAEERASLNAKALENASQIGFSVFLAGGFDGVNIFDADKSSLTSDACVREENNELLDGDLEGPTITSYKRAANLIADENLLLRDIVCMPGIESNAVRKNNASLAAEEKSYLYIQDVPLINYNYEIVTGSKSEYVENFASVSGEPGEESQDETIIRRTAEAHRRNYFFSSFNASYFGEIKTTLGRDFGADVEKIVPPTILALNNLSSVSPISSSPSGMSTAIGDAQNIVFQDFVDSSHKSNTFKKLYRNRDINVISLAEDGVIDGAKILSARTEDDSKPSLAGAIGTRRARSEIIKRIRDMSIRNFIFNNYISIDTFVTDYNRAVRNILQQYVSNNILESFDTNIQTSNMSQEDIRNGILRGSISMKFVGRADLGSEEDSFRIDEILSDFENLVK